MSLLTNGLPESLSISGKDCPIKTDFKVWLKFSEIMGQGISEAQKLPEIFKLIFDELPPNLFNAMAEIIDFYRCGASNQKNTTDRVPQKRIFDFEFDADLIYAAFLQQYKIDLCNTEMHWWKFKALFDCLSEETKFMKVLGYRSIDISKIRDKKQKQQYRKLKELYRLPDNRSEEQKEKDFSLSIASMF